MKQYLDLMRAVLEHGVKKPDRTNTGVISIFGYQMRFDLQKFPLLTTKKLHTRSIIHELLWFLKGETNISYLRENKVSIWDEWADDKGELGPVYGAQWRAWPTESGSIDQIKKVIADIKADPHSRRLMVSAWNVSLIHKMALPPCHCLMQFYVANNKLSCQLYQRAGDVFLGVPFNIASYALLTCMMAHVTGLLPGELVHILGDAHLYLNHLEQARFQLEREPLELSTLHLNPLVKNIDDFTFEDITIENYQAHPHIKARVSV